MFALYVCRKILLREKGISYRFCALRQWLLAGYRGIMLLAIAIGILCSFISLSPDVLAMGDASKFTFAQLRYNGGNWNPRPNAGKRLMWELVKRTSVEARIESAAVSPGDTEIFEYPFIYLSGDQEFPPFSDAEISNLKLYLEFGGMLLIDDCMGKAGFGFDTSARREIKRLFPNRPLERLPPDHTVFKSFYLLNQAYGRIAEKPYLEGVTIENRTVIVFSQNDLGGAWSRDPMGNWEYEVIPGGETQRAMAFRLGVNIVMYALTGNYKQDQVHLPFILKRQM